MNRFEIDDVYRDDRTSYFVIRDMFFNEYIKGGNGEYYAFQRQEHAECFAQALNLGEERRISDVNEIHFPGDNQ